MKLSIKQNFVDGSVDGHPHAKTPIKPPVWRPSTQVRPHFRPYSRFLGVWTCEQCVSPLRGSARRDTRAASTLLPWGRA